MVIDLYQMLGVPRNADRKVLAERFERLRGDVGPGGPTSVQAIELGALELLIDPEKRRAYDRTLDEEGSETALRRVAAMVEAAAADGTLHAAEEAAIVNEGEALGLSRTAVRSFVRAYAEERAVRTETDKAPPGPAPAPRDRLSFIVWAGAVAAFLFAAGAVVLGTALTVLSVTGYGEVPEIEGPAIELPELSLTGEEPDFSTDFDELSELDFEVWAVGDGGVVERKEGLLMLRDAELGVRRDFGPDYEAEAIIRFVETYEEETPSAGIILRRGDGSGFKVGLTADGEVFIKSPEGVLLTAKNVRPFDAGADFALTARCEGDVYYVGVNGTAVAAVRGAASAGRTGLYAENCTVYADKLKVRVI